MYTLQASKCDNLMSIFDSAHATTDVTNLTNYSVQEFFYSFVLF